MMPELLLGGLYWVGVVVVALVLFFVVVVLPQWLADLL